MAVKVIEALKGVNAYPIPLRTLFETAEKRGLDLDGEATGEVLKEADPKGRLLCL